MKHATDLIQEYSDLKVSFNRTSMELKHGLSDCQEYSDFVSFNRTLVWRLKTLFRSYHTISSDASGANLLIPDAPVAVN